MKKSFVTSRPCALMSEEWLTFFLLLDVQVVKLVGRVIFYEAPNFSAISKIEYTL